MNNEATITVTLTVEESMALRLAPIRWTDIIYGPPDPLHRPLVAAQRKLREAEAATPDRPRKLAGHPLTWEGDDA